MSAFAKSQTISRRLNMTAMSNYAEDKVLDHSLGTASWTAPTNIYVGLFLTGNDPTDANSGTEISGNGYARVTATFTAASGGSTSNDSAITFAAASGGNWGEVSYVGLYDASTGGNLIYHGAVTTPKTIEDGDTFSIATGSLTISLD